MNDIIMTKLLEGQEKMHDKLTSISERAIHVEEIVKRHDDHTFPKIEKELEKQSNALFRMESKQNADMTYFVSEKEKVYNELNGRLIKVEDDMKIRQDGKKEVKVKLSGIIWGGIEKVSYIIVGYIITKINYLK